MTEGSELVNRFVRCPIVAMVRGMNTMRKIVIALAGAACLAACTPLNLFYKEGAPISRLNKDLADCKIIALQDVPVDTDTRYIPGTEMPRTICDASGNCHTIWVQVSPDRIETYDANEGARREYVQACMAQSGYQPVRLPACNDAITRSTKLKATTVLPPLEANSCAIKLNTGQWQIVTPPG